MHGNPRYRPGAGRGRGRGQQPPPYLQPSQPPPPPGVNMNSNLPFQDPNLIVQSLLVNNLLQNLASQQQQHGFNFPVQQNPNFQFQSLNFAPTQPPPQQAGTTAARQQQLPSPSVGKQEKKVNKKEMMERVDRAVEKAWRAIIETGESVSAWKVSQAALESLEVDSWGSLGFKMQEVPSLLRLILTEGKINAFINCFVGVRRITTLYDLEVAICKNEGVEKFEELELGPLVKHPLVLHYFSVNSDVTKVVKITSEKVVMWLSEFMDASKKKEISADEFLEFIASKHSVKQKELLGVRIQSLGMHISFIQEAKGSEKETIQSCRTILERKSNNCGKKRLLSASQKKVLDERFSSISQRVESFSLVHKDFSGKHTRFVSSSSEDEKSDDNILSYEDTVISNKGSNVISPLQNVYGAERVSGCPYPSASEERSRLGLKNETSSQKPSAGGGLMKERSNRLFKRKRKLGSNLFTPSKLLKSETETQKSHVTASSNESEKIDTFSEEDISLYNNSIKVFVTTWKEACREKTVSKVLEKMIRFYYPKGSMSSSSRKQIRSTFSMHPFIELLNVAVTSIKCGMWDSMYDAFQAINQNEQTNINSSECERIDVEPAEKPIIVISEQRVQQTSSVTVEDIIGRVTRYYELDPEIQKNSKTPYSSLRELCNCESWLVDQFGVKEFKSLGHGDFFSFIEKHGKLLPSALQNLWAGEISEKSSLEVCVSQYQLLALVSQASNSLWDNETITKQMISTLLVRQFPLLGFKVMENGSMEDFLEIVEKHRNEVISKCVIFSASLQGDSFPSGDDNKLEITSMRNNSDLKMSTCGPVSQKDAIEVLTAAPMLSDLNSWSHWDQIFAPSLGPLVGWLLTEVNSNELLCLVTKNGKVIKIDPSATADLFLSFALQRSTFQTAVNLLSLFSLTGGEKHVPVSLLKCYARRALDVLLSDHDGNEEVEDRADSSEHEKIVDVDLDCIVKKDSTRINDAVRAASRFVIDSLAYLPSEFRGFAADILLYGLQSVMRAAPSCILSMCTQQERIMFHEIGLSIGILEWVDDYHAFCSNQETQCITSGQSSFEVAQSSLHLGSTRIHNTVDVICYAGGRTVASLREDAHDEKFIESGQTVDGAAISNHEIGDKGGQLPDDSNCEDAIRLIESIRRDEFGLDPSLSISESCMLKKQHARLGRALHCLSQELYSQDSHFILELVQNADDNIYPENEEPTLTFILQELGIIILNNEQGFSAQNIRALCDVGNSTKKGSDAGYIGQKGIGFKSVFRVTDAPEIHSKGFHIKFDISEGQIGFVLPTIVPPCNADFFSRLLSGDDEQINKKCWNTCIVLPFRSKFSGETVINMFSDLHPSLLLFLHRLECIMFRNMLNDSLIIMKKETLADGIVNVSCGKDKMTWLVASQKLQGHASRPKVQTTEIAIAFTLEESDNGVYSPRLEQQPVFSFLPLRTYGLKFILQGDFVLPSSREEVDKNNPWNEWLLMNFPALFVSAEKDFCALSCFRENPGKAVSAFMSFVPLVGEVHGFFSRLPKAIILELRRTECLLLEGDNSKMVPPCNVLRGWNEQARHLLPDDLLQRHLGLGFLDKNIVISDPLARALGIVEYGPEILVRFMTCLSNTENSLKLMGLCWLSYWLDSLYVMLSYSSESANLIERLKNIPFIPLSDGTYSSVDVDAVWLHSDGISTNLSSILGLEAFPNLYAKLRTVNPFLLSSSSDRTVGDNVTGMLHRIGVQELSAHEIIKVHILPAICDGRSIHMDKNLLTDYLCFVMIHLQSSCHNCYMERTHIISELQNKAYILSNHGCKKLTETPIHFSREFGNPIDVNKLVDVLDMRWHEVDINYLKHPANEALSNGLGKWREFFREIGVRDFVQVAQTEKTWSDLSQTVLKNITWDRDLISSGLLTKDWESPELMNLLSLLSRSGDRECCKYLLEILDMLWNDEFSDKVTGYFSVNGNGDGRLFTSSFVYNICDVQWVVSSIDNKLHFPKELFYDCDAVRSILGASASYALPKIKSEMLVRDIGFKTRVALIDALKILTIWREGGPAFEASIAQMTKFYTFMWDEMAASRNKILDTIRAGPFIFVPSRIGSRHEDLVPGFFFSLEEVYWHDPTGSVDQLRRIHTKCTVTANERPMSKTLCNIYPGLHDFFKECGVRDFPSSYAYLDILQQLSTVTSPSRSASLVFQVFLRWADELKSGLLRSDDIIYLKECLLKLEYAVLPTVQDKWVSLHPSFGLVCWCDDEKLADRCKNTSNIDFLCFGDLDDHEKEIIQTKMSVLMQNLGIPAFSEVITREPIYYGLSDRSSKFSLINWVLPFAQRYIYSTHPEKYYQLKQSGFNSLKQLNLVVVEKLFYVNVIKGVGVASEKRCECSALLQGNTLYATVESDPHALFLELSRLFFDGASDLHMANFLHLITTMAESGSTHEQAEFFIVNSQNVQKLPDEESVWSLPSVAILAKGDKSLQSYVASLETSEEKVRKSKKKAGVSSNWPPADWKTAPDFNYARAHGFKTQAAASPDSRSDKLGESSVDNMTESKSMWPVEISTDWTIEENNAETVILDSESGETGDHVLSPSQNLEVAIKPDELHLVSDAPEVNSSIFSRREQLNTGTVNTAQALLTGRLGEHVAYKYLTDKFGTDIVRWVNEDSESGLPYDIVVGGEEGIREYIEVKATRYARKDWFNISMREWRFAVEKGDSFSIAHVMLFGNNSAKVTTFKNPVKQCQQGKLQLVVMMPRQQESSDIPKE